MYQHVRITESDAARCWPRAHDRARVIQVQSPDSTLHHMSRSIPHMARDVEISHLPPSTFEFDYIAVHHYRADAQRIRLGAYNGSERCRASQEPAVSTTRRARCTVQEKMPDPGPETLTRTPREPSRGRARGCCPSSVDRGCLIDEQRRTLNAVTRH